MSQTLKDILTNVQEMTESESILAILMDFERVLDELNLYAFRNWKLGELIKGPVVSKYRVSCTFMWPKKLMPDPQGGERLLKFGIKTRWGKDKLIYPVKVKSSADFKPGTKKPKLASSKIWCVEIIVPKSLIKQVEGANLDYLSQHLDLTDIDSAYESDFENLSTNADQLEDQETANTEKSAGEAQ